MKIMLEIVLIYVYYTEGTAETVDRLSRYYIKLVRLADFHISTVLCEKNKFFVILSGTNL